MHEAGNNECQNVRRVLALDGGGVRGAFSAAFLAAIEEQLELPIGNYFDLIVGTSTGGIISLGLGHGLTAAEILQFYQNEAENIFNPGSWGFLSKVGQTGAMMFGAKHQAEGLQGALKRAFGERKLGHSQNRLVIPSWHKETESLYLFKTAHHPRFSSDYKRSMVDVALATSAAPLYLPSHTLENGVELVDGGVWSNNPIGVAVAEAIGVLKWEPSDLRVLSIGTIAEVRKVPKMLSVFGLLRRKYILELLMEGQSKAALAFAKILTGHPYSGERIFRINDQVAAGTFAMDDPGAVASLVDRGTKLARESIPALRTIFFADPADRFNPVYELDEIEK